ncbi:hypothetical protein Y032_0106g3746 [Ancylostoma ceylanicum]|uniref:Uncharacterized protein n=1 Tax=Ancylostoma ceylanicum TaxID=53326 RepID=A0A016TF46_9BILA|nr:hypothetical protein Y032_0106g3746 [Ancylostoma ceylanicum]
MEELYGSENYRTRSDRCSPHAPMLQTTQCSTNVVTMVMAPPKRSSPRDTGNGKQSDLQSVTILNPIWKYFQASQSMETV